MHPRFSTFALLAFAGWTGLAGQTTPPSIDPHTVALPKFEVKEHADDEQFDRTGMGSHEEDLRGDPFANELTAVDLDREEGLSVDTNAELSAISTTSPAAAAAGEERLNLRGFPTPTLRNGFIQIGILETLNVGRTIRHQSKRKPWFQSVEHVQCLGKQFEI